MAIVVGRGRRVRRGLTTAAAAALGSVGLGPARATDWSPPRTVFVTEAGHTVDGLFLDLWRDQNALLGDPITEEFSSQRGYAASADAERVVQFFVNGALAYLPDAAPAEQVQLVDLGQQEVDRLLDLGGADGLAAAMRATTCPAAGDCVAVVETDQTVRGKLLAFWTGVGEARWLGLPLTEAFRAADGSYVQYFERGALRLDRAGEVAPLPLGRTVATRQRLDTAPIDRPEEIPVYAEALFVSPAESELAPEPDPASELGAEPDLEPHPESGLEPWVAGAFATPWSVGTFGPGPQAGSYKEIVVSISQQATWAYENGELVVSSYVSTGTAEVPATTTPIGYWSVLSKYEVQDMEGTISDEYYFVPDVPNILYFDNLGNALHGTYWHSNFGTPMSHGCVNLPLDVAAFVFGWAPVGTPVTVIP